MSHNGKKKDAHQVIKRDEKGRFIPGFGGPGRPKAKPFKPMSLQDIESALQEDLRSKDPKIRHTATKLLLTLKRQMGKQDDNSHLLSPVMMALMQSQVKDQQAEDADYEVIED